MEKPSQSKEDYWIYAHPPKEEEIQIIESAVNWFEDNSESYLRSGMIYPRDIYLEEMIKPKTNVDKLLMKIDHEAIKIARADLHSNYHLLYGKWLIYIPRNVVDEVWEKLLGAIESGKLPYEAKVATAKRSPLRRNQEHVICIYTPNYLFREDVRHCRNILRNMGFQKRLYYKPDIFTYKGMYRIYGSKINHRYFG